MWMGFAGVTLGMGCNSGCSGNKQGTPPQAATAASGQANAESGQAPVTAHGAHLPAPRSEEERVALAQPAHRFQPQPIAPRSRPAPLPPPNPYALPAFVDGSARCLGYEQPRPVPYSHPYPPTASGPRPPSTPTYGDGYGTRFPRVEEQKGRSRASAAGSGSPREPIGADASSPSKPKSAAAPSPAAAAESSSPRRAEGTAQGRGDAARSSRPAPAPTAAPPLPPGNKKAEAEAPSDRYRADDEYLPEPQQPDEGFGAAIYLSNDDTMSLSSAQRVIWAIDRYQPIKQSQIRPHELLNYFSFQTAPVPTDRDFSVVANLAPSTTDANIYSLALAVKGRSVTAATRRNVNLAYAIDRSGSMAAEGRMDYLKRGLLRSLQELKNGDVVHISLFDTTACNLAQNFVVGRDPMQRLEQLISRIQPRGSTNLYDGLTQAYHSADVAYQPGYSNRVVLITDALANEGVTDETLIGMVGQNYDARRIRLSGVGVGSQFNDSLIDRLTERGRGGYVFLGSEAEVDAVFGSRFVSLVETVANDVHFKLSLPPSLAMNVFYGEEASTVKERVQAIHYFANTSQLFLSDLKTRDGYLHYQDDLMLSIEYEDPETQAKMVEEYAFNLGQIWGDSRNVKKAQLLTRFIRELGAMAERPLPSRYGYSAAAWYDDDAYGKCGAVRGELASLASGIEDDPEVRRVQGLWDTFCSRYAVPQYAPPPPPPYQPPPPPVYRPQPTPPTPYPYSQPPRNNDYPPPQRNNDYAPPDGWPSAQR
jgi:Ca-activated chloride channel family protein